MFILKPHQHHHKQAISASLQPLPFPAGFLHWAGELLPGIAVQMYVKSKHTLIRALTMAPLILRPHTWHLHLTHTSI